MHPFPTEQVRTLINAAKKVAPETALIAVVNVKSQSKQLVDYALHSMRTSFLNDYEITDMLGAMRDCGFYVQHFADESTFFEWVLGGDMHRLALPNKLVYTTALNGKGPGRRALVPAFCAHFGIQTLNSDAYSCAINRQKFHCARLLSTFGIRTPRTWYFVPQCGWFDGEKPDHGFPVIAKATYEGSSVGVDSEVMGPFSSTMEDRIEKFSRALEQPIVVQELIGGYEIEVPMIRLERNYALGVAALSLDGEAFLNQRVLAYDGAWDDDYAFTDPVNLHDTAVAKIAATAERTADVLNFRGINRVDFRVDRQGEAFLIDVSSTPHLTTCNSVSYLFECAGFAYCDVFATLAGLGMRESDIHSSDQNSRSDTMKPRP